MFQLLILLLTTLVGNRRDWVEFGSYRGRHMNFSKLLATS